MNAMEKNFANMRGETLAANLLATAALQAIFMMTPNRDELLNAMTAFIDDTLNRSGPGKGDAHDELNTQMREVARFQTMQTLQHIKRMIDNMPKPTP